MNSSTSLPRREFLQAAGGVIGLAAACSGLAGKSFAADSRGAAGAKKSAELPALLEEMDALGRRMLSVPKEDGQFLHLLVKATRARNVLEIGTSQGYSAIWISLGLEETGGKMTTIDIDPEKTRLAKANLARAGLAHRATCLEGDAHRILPTLDGPFDFVFLDADKGGQVDYFQKLHPQKLVPGAVLLAHNAIRSRSAMQDYLDLVGRHPDFDAVVLSLTMSDGFSVSYRKRTA